MGAYTSANTINDKYGSVKGVKGIFLLLNIYLKDNSSGSIIVVIYIGFFGWVVHQMFGGPIFECRNGILLLGKGLKFSVICQKYALKLIEIWQLREKICEKRNFSQNYLKFRAAKLENKKDKIGRL